MRLLRRLANTTLPRLRLDKKGKEAPSGATKSVGYSHCHRPIGLLLKQGIAERVPVRIE
jgi:hypothetical protein